MLRPCLSHQGRSSVVQTMEGVWHNPFMYNLIDEWWLAPFPFGKRNFFPTSILDDIGKANIWIRAGKKGELKEAKLRIRGFEVHHSSFLHPTGRLPEENFLCLPWQRGKLSYHHTCFQRCWNVIISCNFYASKWRENECASCHATIHQYYWRRVDIKWHWKIAVVLRSEHEFFRLNLEINYSKVRCIILKREAKDYV